MKGQRWKHIVLEGRGEEGVTTSEKMKAIYRGGRVKKKGVEAINSVKKRVTTVQKRFVCADHRSKASDAVRNI